MTSKQKWFGLFHRHEWSKWSREKQGVFSGVDRLAGVDRGEQPGVYQERECKTCGKKKVRKL